MPACQAKVGEPARRGNRSTMLNHLFLSREVALAVSTPYQHDSRLVAVSCVVAVFAAFTAFELIARMRAASNQSARVVWLMTAGLSMGLGFWAMHFTAMLAVEIPIPIRFDLPATALFAGVAVI